MTSLDRIKVDIAPWDSAKNPHGFFEWIGHFSSVVKSTEPGMELEDFIDVKVGRTSYDVNFAPSWVAEDPDFNFQLDEESDLKTDSKLKPIFDGVGDEEGEMDSPFKEAKGLMKDPPRAKY